MTKKELALLYWDGPLPEDPKTAVRRLSRWIIINTELFEELKATGYVLKQKVLTKKQVEIIYKHLGEP